MRFGESCATLARFTVEEVPDKHEFHVARDEHGMQATPVVSIRYVSRHIVDSGLHLLHDMSKSLGVSMSLWGYQ